MFLQCLTSLIFCDFYDELGFLKENLLFHPVGDCHPYPSAGLKHGVKFDTFLSVCAANAFAEADGDSPCGNPVQLVLC